MRQAGIIAAGALYALANHRERLVEDHDNAKALAKGICHLPGVVLDPAHVETNIVLLGVTGVAAREVATKLADTGVAVLATGTNAIRAVTSLMVSREDVERAIEAFAVVLDS